jgi:hypothetical protein
MFQTLTQLSDSRNRKNHFSFGKIFSSLIIAVFAITSFFASTAYAQPVSEEEVKAEIQKNSALFTPELIQKADPFVIYDENGDAILLKSLENLETLTKDEKKLVKNAVKNYNLLPKKDKTQNIQDKKTNKETFGHVSGVSYWFNWWGVSLRLDGTHLANSVNNASFIASISGPAITAACSYTGIAVLPCTFALTVAVQAQVWYLRWCQINRGYVIFNLNPFNRTAYYFC